MAKQSKKALTKAAAHEKRLAEAVAYLQAQPPDHRNFAAAAAKFDVRDHTLRRRFHGKTGLPNQRRADTAEQREPAAKK